MKFLKYFYLFIAVLLLIVVVQNLEPSGLNVLVWKYELPKGVLWIVLVAMGSLLSELRHLMKPKDKKIVLPPTDENLNMNI